MFSFNLTNLPVWSQHEGCDTLHAVGRFLHAPNLCHKIVGLPNDPGGPGWIGYSQHSYNCLPLPTNYLCAEEVLDFRDAAFNITWNEN